MNYIKQMFAVALLFSITAQGAITINDQEINSIAQPGQVITYKTSGEADNIAFSFKDKHLSIGYATWDQPQQIKDFMQQLEKQNLSLMDGEVLKMKSVKDTHYSESVFVGKNELILQSAGTISLENCIMRAPKMILAATSFNFDACFVHDAPCFQLESTSAHSLIRAIRFTLSENAQLPCLIEGSLDLNSGEMSKNFIVTGVDQVDILFSDEAFAK